MIDEALQIVRSDIAHQIPLVAQCRADTCALAQIHHRAQAGLGYMALHRSMKSINQPVVVAWT